MRRKIFLFHRVQSDVNRLREMARIIFQIVETNRGPRILVHPNFGCRNMLIGVIGPGTGLAGTPVEGKLFEQAVLLEVGSSRLWSKRKKWFELTGEQRQLVMPYVTKAVQNFSGD